MINRQTDYMAYRWSASLTARTIKYVTIGVAALSFASCAPAQTVDTSEWKVENSAPSGLKQIGHPSGAKIFAGPTEMREGKENLPSALIPLISQQCSQMVAAPNQRANDGLGIIKTAVQPNKVRCTLALRPSTKGGTFALLLSMDEWRDIDPVPTSYQFAILAAGGDPQGGKGAANIAAASNVGTQGNAPADLRRILASVSPGNRPIAVAYRNEATFVGDQLQQQMKPWLIFANGNASDCFEWDPRFTSPTAANATKSCSVTKWKKQGSGYAFLDNGTWEEGVEDYVAQPMPSNVALSGNWESWSGVSFASTGPGTVGYARVAVNKIGFEPGGKFFDASKSMTWQAANSASNTMGSGGHYATDGYLIAFARGGQISVGYFAVVAEAGKIEFFWLNGNQYGPES